MNCTAAFTSQQHLAASRLRPRRAAGARRMLRVRAAATPGQEPQQQAQKGAFEELERNANLMLQKYDFLSAGLGALAVTTFCVARGQDPYTALWITGASTVVALLLNELLFEEGK